MTDQWKCTPRYPEKHEQKQRQNKFVDNSGVKFISRIKSGTAA
jgi:hypothetical protein